MSDSLTIGWVGPKHTQWEWMLGHFREVVALTERNAEDWFQSQSRPTSTTANPILNPSVLLVAIESRFDPALEWIKRLENKLTQGALQSNMPWAVVLGDDWVGHRRTHPLPETWQSFYWYELYDRLLPWLIEISDQQGNQASADQGGNASKRRISPRVQRIIDSSVSIASRLRGTSKCLKPIRMAMVVSETATTRQLWCDALNAHEIQTLATTPENVDLWTTPDIIVVDLEAEPLEMRDSRVATGIESPRVTLVGKLAKQFPDATLLVADAFPRWETWSKLMQFGADILIAKPYQLPGVLDTLRHCG